MSDWVWFGYVIEYENGSEDVLECSSAKRYGYFDDMYIPNSNIYPGDYRGTTPLGPEGGEISFGYNMLATEMRGHATTDTFLYPTRTGILAETGSVYWWNEKLDNTLGYWYSDRHRKDFGQVLFMDAHVDWVETPYPNGTKAFDGENIRDPS